jgi:hypothetical protein
MPKHFIMRMTVLQTLHSTKKLRFRKDLARLLELLRSSKKLTTEHPLDEFPRLIGGAN